MRPWMRHALLLPPIGLSVLLLSAIASGETAGEPCSTARAPGPALGIAPEAAPGLLVAGPPAAQPPRPRGPGGPPRFLPPPGYLLLGEREAVARLRQGERWEAMIDTAVPSLDAIPPAVSLTGLAQQALDAAPDWIREDLRDRLRSLSPADQDSYAGILLNAPEARMRDEIAFQVAHLPVPVLTHPQFYRELITENAADLYAFDAGLAYADIVDIGDPSAGGDYWSTVRYRVLDPQGRLVERTFERDVYYWFIVHPKLSDELPTYIDPDAPAMDTPAPPPQGRFWRRYLMTGSDPNPTPPPASYPTLQEMLAGVATLWNSRPNQEGARNGAVGVVSQWMDTLMRYDLPPSGERSIQPVRILHNHCGRCGEQQDLLVAAARSALIPAYCASAFANDHVWGEFFEGGKWRLWDCSDNAPATIDPPQYYDGWGYGGVSAVTAWRGDGWAWTVTDKYTPYSVLNVTAVDRNGAPVDGARVLLATWFNTGPGTDLVILTWSFTDSRGKCSFLLGDQKEIFVRLDSAIGSFPSVPNQVASLISPQTEPGQVYDWTYTFDLAGHGAVPALEATPAAPGPGTPLLLGAEWSAPREYVTGTCPFDSLGGFAWETAPGDLTAFLCDDPNYSAYRSAGPFEAHAISRGAGGGAGISQGIPAPGTWRLVLGNDEELADPQLLEVRVSLWEYREDADGDTVVNSSDNCPGAINPLQEDSDADGLGNACDNCAGAWNPGQEDGDGDTLADACDPCPAHPADDGDLDGLCGDLDNCPYEFNPSQSDADGDAAGDDCDLCPTLVDPGQEDGDADGAGDACDNCPGYPNPLQEDSDGDTLGDACQPPDSDGDGVHDLIDNCPSIPNPGQENPDNDPYGTACDNCPGAFNPSQFDSDGDTFGNSCDCDAQNAAVWTPPHEVASLWFAGPQTLAWSPEDPATGPAVRWDVIRGLLSLLRSRQGIDRAQCLFGGEDLPTTSVADPATPPAGDGFYYLVRAQNDCPGSGTATYGRNSAGTDRGRPTLDDCL